eukprot:SAG11_NODE_27_length_23309_cov_10.579362_12_plen_93_part_00
MWTPAIVLRRVAHGHSCLFSLGQLASELAILRNSAKFVGPSIGKFGKIRAPFFAEWMPSRVKHWVHVQTGQHKSSRITATYSQSWRFRTASA